jgi:hypothetical protein
MMLCGATVHLLVFRIISLNTGQRVAHILELIAQERHGIGFVVLNISTSVISGAVETIVVVATVAIVRMISAIAIITTILVCIAPKISITDFALIVQTTFVTVFWMRADASSRRRLTCHQPQFAVV